jgi:hypothetical protein
MELVCANVWACVFGIDAMSCMRKVAQGEVCIWIDFNAVSCMLKVAHCEA